MDENSNGLKTNNEKKVSNRHLELGDDWDVGSVRPLQKHLRNSRFRGMCCCTLVFPAMSWMFGKYSCRCFRTGDWSETGSGGLDFLPWNWDEEGWEDPHHCQPAWPPQGIPPVDLCPTKPELWGTLAGVGASVYHKIQTLAFARTYYKINDRVLQPVDLSLCCPPIFQASSLQSNWLLQISTSFTAVLHKIKIYPHGSGIRTIESVSLFITGTV